MLQNKTHYLLVIFTFDFIVFFMIMNFILDHFGRNIFYGRTRTHVIYLTKVFNFKNQ